MGIRGSTLGYLIFHLRNLKRCGLFAPCALRAPQMVVVVKQSEKAVTVNEENLLVSCRRFSFSWFIALCQLSSCRCIGRLCAPS